MESQWLSPQNLADEFGVPVATIYSWRAKGYGPRGIHVGRHVRYSRKEVDRWTAEQMAASA